MVQGQALMHSPIGPELFSGTLGTIVGHNGGHGLFMVSLHLYPLVNVYIIMENHGTSTFPMDKHTISMAISHSYVTIYQRVTMVTYGKNSHNYGKQPYFTG